MGATSVPGHVATAKPKINLSLFGKTARIQLSVGLLGFLTILTLALLFCLALVFALIARKKLREARVANEKLEMEIQERQRAEEKVRQLNASLEQRVAERTREVQEANQQLAATNKELEAFSYSVSHDLRAPLRGVDGWSQAVVEDYGSQLDDRAREYLARVRTEAQRMNALIDNLLELSRVTRMEMNPHPVDLTAIANRIVARMQETNANRRTEFVIAPGLTAHGDEGLLEIVLVNLLSNAAKFSSGCQSPRIQLGQLQQNGELPFFVRDNGVGFDMAFAGELFGAFQRLHKASEFPGTGIGLATVQRVIHRHGGRVWAEAEVGKGASFYFTLRPAK
jgi:light-regulated signal transduction histidine kinase (bacteriophytochrome)